MAILIRKGEAKDSPMIAKFQLEMAMETEQKSLDFPTVETAVGKVFEDPSKGFYLVAENDGCVISSLLITFEWSDWRNSQLWYIQSVFVSKPFRGQGVFRTLYQAVVAEAKANDVMFIRLYVEKENIKAQKTYESLGMKRLPYYMYDVRVDC